MIKKAILFFSFLTITQLKAQQWIDKMQNPNENFYSIKQEFDSYWQGKPYERGKGYKQFKRWEEFVGPRVYPSGDMKLSSMSKAHEEFNAYLQNNPNAYSKLNSGLSTASTFGNWIAKGPFGSPTNGDAGRVNFIRFHPTNSSIIFIGTPGGGVWKSTNSGSSWSTTTNSLANLGSSDLAIDPTNANVMYLATGDFDGQQNYSIGILKSTDGGVTWATTGLTFAVSQQALISRVVIDPLNSSVLFATTSLGLYRSANSGTSWTVVKSTTGVDPFNDIEFEPSSSTQIYAVTKSKIYKTTTGGTTSASWVDISTSFSGLSAKRLAVAVTVADPNYVYVLAGKSSDYTYQGLYRSTDGGSTFSLMSSSPNIFDYSFDASGTSGQAWYDMCLAVSPTNKNEVVVGAINSWISSNGGVSWTLQTHWYDATKAPVVHADAHSIEYQTGSKMFLGTDGGFFYSTNTGASWTQSNGSMNIAQVYNIGSSSTSSSLLIAGHQDNGTNMLNGSTWSKEYGGDGGFSFIDWSNDNNMVGSVQNGQFIRSIGGGAWATATVGLSGTAAFIAPIIQSPTSPNTYYCAYSQVFKSTNQGGNWTQMGTISNGGAAITKLAVAPSNSLVLYAITNYPINAIYKTINGGTSWTDITTGLPSSSAAISNLAIDNANSSKLYVSFSGYSSANKLYTSTNGGSTWTNVSTGLPNLPVNCIVLDKNGTDTYYVGTDVGVYYKDPTLTTYTPFMSGLPNVVVKDLEIHYASSKLRAGTFGRGVWESDLYSTTSLDASIQSIINPINGSTSCNNSVIPKVVIKNIGSTTLTSLSVLYKMDATTTQTLNWTGSLVTSATTTITLNTYSGLTAAAHNFSVWTSMPNAGVDANTSNDDQLSTFTITSSSTGVSIPFTEDFEASTFPPSGWSHLNTNVQNSSYIWKRTLNSTGIPVTPLSAAIAEFDNQSSTVDITGQLNALKTPALDFSTGTSSLKLEFDVAHQQAFPNQYFDSLMVYISTNCGSTWTKLYNKGDGATGNLATITGTAGYNQFVPSSNTDWRRETVSLASYAGMSGVYLKFENKSGWGSNTYIDNINITSTSTSTVNLDASIQSIINPINGSTSCNSSIIPKVVLQNLGLTTLTSVKVLYKMDATTTQTLNWTGSLASNATATVTLNTYSGLTAAAHNFSVWTSTPNSGVDANTSNDDQLSTFTITSSSTGVSIPFTEDFEASTFPPSGWSHLNTNVQNSSYIWKRTLNSTGIPVTPLSAAIAEFDNQSSTVDITGQLNALKTPALDFSTGTSSLKLEFDVSHKKAFPNQYRDSLMVYISTNCGLTWTKLYTKGDGTSGNLATVSGTVGYAQYVPTSNTDWRRETVSLASYAGLSGVYLKFENKSGWGTNTYIDNINITSTSTSTVNLDASIQSIINPINGSTSCNNSIIPKVILQNLGLTILTSVKVLYKMDATTTQTLNWTGSLATSVTTTITLNTYSGLIAAAHNFSVWTSTPNSGVDANTSNDDQLSTFTITSSSTGVSIPFTEDFEASTFPPSGWSHLNTNVQNSSYIWKRTLNSTGIPVTPLSAAVAEFDNQSSTVDITGQLNALKTPALDFSTGTSSLKLEFDVSHKQAFPNQYRDSLMVYISTNCGLTWTKLYTKGDGTLGNLATVTGTAGYAQYVPTSNTDWRRETISLASYAGLSGVYLKFENKSGWGTNTYIDNINITSTNTSGPIVANFASVAPNCSGQNISFNDLSSGTPNTWSWSFPGASPSSSSLQNPTVTYTAAGIYSVTLVATDGVNSFTPLTNTFVVNGAPIISVNSATICTAGSATLVASGANTYTWSTGTIGSSEIVSPISNTIYTVYGESVNGCFSSALTNVVIGSSVSISVSSSTICSGSTAILSVSGASSFTWSNGSNASSISVSPTTNMTYTVIGNSVGCGSDTKIATVVVNALPTLSVISPTICSGGTATLIASGATTYTWSTGSNGAMLQVSPTFNTAYTVGGSSASGCTSYITGNVVVASSPVITITNTTICAGQNAILTATGANTYTWSTGATGSPISVSPTLTTIYNVVGNMTGCSGSASKNVTVTVNPLPTPSISPVAAMCSNAAPVSIITSPVGGTLTGTGIMLGSFFDPSVSGVGTFPINYYYTNINGCSNVASQTMTVSNCTGVEELTNDFISIFPNPTEDNLNIQFKGEMYKNTSLYLYDAIGKLVLKEEKVKENECIVSMKNLSKGFYILKINSENKQQSFPIIKK